MPASTLTGTGDREPRRFLGGLPGSELPGRRFVFWRVVQDCTDKFRKASIVGIAESGLKFGKLASFHRRRASSDVLLSALKRLDGLKSWSFGSF